MSATLKQLRTKQGILAADVKTTFHVNWLTYAHNIQAGQMGLEGLFKEAYGKPIEMTEGRNDTHYKHEVKREVFAEYSRISVDECIERGWFEDYMLGSMLRDLCNKGVIPEGCYVVSVSW